MKRHEYYHNQPKSVYFNGLISISDILADANEAREILAGLASRQ